MGGESDVTPYLFSRYFGLRSLSALYGFTWRSTGLAGAIEPVLMGRAYDATGSYETLSRGSRSSRWQPEEHRRLQPALGAPWGCGLAVGS